MSPLAPAAPVAPLPPGKVKPLPFHGLNKLYFQAFVTWYRFLDRRDAGVA